jgi:hypothetical protein
MAGLRRRKLEGFSGQARQAVGAGRRTHVLVKNRSEWNVPLTVQGLVRMLRRKGFLVTSSRVAVDCARGEARNIRNAIPQ